MPHPFCAVAALALLAATGVGVAGPLDPPAGPIASTPGPEPRIAVNAANTPGDADSVFRITQAGSYYLTGNVTGVAGRHGIEIAALSDVVLDLNGFTLTGVAGSLDGVFASALGASRLEVHSGSVVDWDGDGIDLGSSVTTACVVRNVRSAGNGVIGIRVHISGTVTDCSASNSGSAGIGAGIASAVCGCVVNNSGADGVSVANGSKVVGCVSYSNTGSGYFVPSGGTVHNCTAYDNDGSGIDVSSGCTVTGCAAYENGGTGIEATSGSTIIGNSARFNVGDGIFTGGEGLVLNNTCTRNGAGAGIGAGIRVTGSRTRVEGNNCTDNDRGINIEVGGNIIVRNTCAANTTNWTIVANNVFGPIIDRSAPASPAVNGNAAASTLGSTDANANYTY